MNNLSPQRKKVVLMACSITVLNLPGLLITHALHESRFLPAFVIGWCTMLVGLLAYTLVEFVKLKRGEG